MGNSCQNGTLGNNYYNYNRLQNEHLASRCNDGNDFEDCYSSSSRSSVAALLRQGLNLASISVLEQKTPNIREHYTLGQKLGQGEFGITYLCTNISTRCQHACKSILKEKFRTMEDIEDVRREIQIMHHLSGHENIVIINDVYEDEEAVHIVMELCAGTELFAQIQQKGHYNEQKAAEIIRIIVDIVARCHSLGVMHRDLKPENFLLVDKDDDLSIKLIDFGLSVFFKPGQVFTQLVGSPFYIAPEVLNKDYGPEADVWTIGVILYVLLSGVPPFWADTQKGIFDKVLNGDVDFQSNPWPKVSNGAKDLIRKMLCPCPSERLKAQQVLKHPWISNNGVGMDLAPNSSAISPLKQISTMDRSKKVSLQAGNDIDTITTWEGFTAALVPLNKIEHEEHLMAAFTYFDKDGSGYITIDKLQKFCMECNMEDTLFEEIILRIDQNNDGKIDYVEFVTMMQNNDYGLRQKIKERSLNVASMKAPLVYCCSSCA